MLMGDLWEMSEDSSSETHIVVDLTLFNSTLIQTQMLISPVESLQPKMEAITT